MNFRPILSILAFIILFSGLSVGQEAKVFPFLFEKSDKTEDIVLGFSHSESYEMNYNYSQHIFKSKPDRLTFENFPVAFNSTDEVLLIKSYNSITDKTEWFRGSSDGILSFLPTDITVYTGKISDDENSKVFLTYSAGAVFAVVQHSNGETFSISPEYKSNAHLLVHHMTSGNRLSKDENPWLCMTEETEQDSYFHEDIKHLNDKPLAPSKLLDVKVACEGTSEFYEMFLDLDRASAYMSSVIAHTSKLYEDNLNVRLTISYVLIWQDAGVDPYRGENLLSEKLHLMPDLWENKNVERSVAVLFASLAAQQGNVRVAGIAYGGKVGKGNVCNNKWGCCVLGIKGGVGFPTTNYAWDINVAAHEIGHLFGAPHTHRCYWNPPIDTCVTQQDDVGDACLKSGEHIPRPGTIMSYCHTTNETRSVQLFFHPLQIPLMRKAAEDASCHSEVSVPYVSLLAPLGGTYYEAGDKIEIRWTSSMVSKVSLKFSMDGGKSWGKIVDYVEAADSIYLWTTPKISTDEVKVLIHDATDMTINDMSLVNFSVNEPSINIILPAANDEYPVSSGQIIEWNSIYVDSVQIEYSIDNGTNWVLIGKFAYKNQLEWTTPGASSNECFVRILSIDGTSVVAQSDRFKIGKPFASILSPIVMDTLCSGESFPVKWQAGYVHKLYLEYSTDNGENWRKITPVPLEPAMSEYNWTVPNRITDEAKVRITAKINDDSQVLDEIQGNFSIHECVTDVIQSKESTVLSITPNPAVDYIQVGFKDAEILETDAYIYDIKGQLIRKLKITSNYRIDVRNLNNGTYVVIVESKNKFMIQKFNILR